MSRRPPWTSSMIAMVLLACGESVARAAPVDEQEQRRMEWARQQAVSRIFSVEEMRQYLRSAGDDEAKADEHLPQLDELTRKTGGSRALQLVDMQLRHLKRPPTSDVIYQEYKDGKLEQPMKMPDLPTKPKPPEPLAAFDAVRAAWHGFEPYDPEDVPIMATPPTRPKVKPRSKSGQRRAHARWGR